MEWVVIFSMNGIIVNECVVTESTKKVWLRLPFREKYLLMKTACYEGKENLSKDEQANILRCCKHLETIILENGRSEAFYTDLKQNWYASSKDLKASSDAIIGLASFCTMKAMPLSGDLEASSAAKFEKAVTEIDHKNMDLAAWSKIIDVIFTLEHDYMSAERRSMLRVMCEGIVDHILLHFDAVPEPKKEKALKTECANCAGEGKALCKRCENTSYCSKSCQRQHWKEGHKRFCVAKDAPQRKVPASFLPKQGDCFVCFEELATHTMKLDCGHTIHAACLRVQRRRNGKHCCPQCFK
jgi:hypothetical protein